MPSDDIPDAIKDLIEQADLSRRARIVVEQITEHGHITTKRLQEEFGYDQPPRAARDVREAGVPLDTEMVTVDGKRTAKYTFGDPDAITAGRLSGRRIYPKQLKRSLYEAHGGVCCICNASYESRYLQIDHRVPYEVAGEIDELNGDPDSQFLLLCASCNRKKSWSCEHCENIETRDVEVCERCYWASPEDYDHVALRPERRVEFALQGEDAALLARAEQKAAADGRTLHSVLRGFLENFLAG